MNETMLEQALWEYFNESPSFLKVNGNRYRAARELVEKMIIKHAMKRTRNCKIQAARAAGMNRNTLRKRADRLGLEFTSAS